MANVNERLRLFALATLKILEADKEWGHQTLDLIDDEAKELGLADSDDEGYFEISKEVKELFK